MSQQIEIRRMSRRDFMREWAAVLMASAMAPVGAAMAQHNIPGKPFPFKLGLQSYSLRGFGLEQALGKTRELGLRWWEGSQVHMPLTSDATKIASYRQSLLAHGVRMITYGVVDFTADEPDARRKFEFANAMGIRTLTAAPTQDSLPLLDKLTQEYAVNIGIHNHGPEDSQWGDWQTILNSVSGLNRRVGACDDTGHYLRANKNPITAAVQFGKRLHAIHMKAVAQGPNGTKPFVPIGTTGNLLDVVQLLRFLKEQEFPGVLAIEEEEQPDNPMPLLAKSVEAMNRYITTANTITLKHDIT